MRIYHPIPEWNGADFVRFWTKVKIAGEDDCWLWNACTNDGGYGEFRLGGRSGRSFHAHRIAWSMGHRVLEIPLHVLHKCDNPPCVNPTHLFLGDDAANVADMIAKGRACTSGAMSAALLGRMPTGEKHHNAKLSAEKVLLIRTLYATRESTWRVLAKQFGVTPSCIQSIIERRTWKHI